MMKMKTHKALHTALLSAALLMLFSLPAHAQDISTGLIGHWKLDETSGTTAFDSGSGGNDGTMTGGLDAGTDSVSGKINTALTFNGSSDYIDTNYNTDFSTGGYTLTAWAKTSAAAPQRILSKLTGINNQKWAMLESGNFECGLHDGALQASSVTGNFNDDSWHFFACVVDGSNITAYVDGIAGTADTHDDTLTTNSTDWNIGRNNAGNEYWDGEIDDVRIYSRALTTEDIAALASGATSGSIRYGDNAESIEYHSGFDWVHAGLGSYAPNGVFFDSSSDYINSSTVTGITDSDKFTMSFWFRIPLGIDDWDGLIYEGSLGGDVQVYINDCWHGSCDDDIHEIQARFRSDRGPGAGDDDHKIMEIFSSDLNAGQWYHALLSFDSSDETGPAIHLYIDDADAERGVSLTSTSNSYLVEFDGNQAVGGLSGNQMGIELADFWVDVGTYLDLTVAANRRKFISATGQPMYLGPDGSLPIGKKPDLFFTGDADDWHTNKGAGGGGFTENGAIEDALDRPFAATWRSASSTNIQKFASDAASDDELGSDSPFGTVNGVAVDGMYAAFGAPGNGTAGAVYVFHTETGEELFKIDAPSGSDPNFGFGVALEGSNLVVGAPGNCGADLYVYDIAKDVTTPQVSVTGLGNCTGWDVDISGDKFIAGTRIGTSAYVYDVYTGTLLHTLNASVGGGGATRAVAIDGDWALVGNPLFDNGGSTYEGRAYLYDLNACGASCTETHALTIAGGAAGDFLGWGAAIDGDYAAVSSPDNVRVYTFDVKTGTELLTIAPSASAGDAFSDFGGDIAIDNKVMAVSQGRGGTNRTGRLEVFDIVTGTSLYSLQNPTGTTNEDRFAASIALDDDVIAAGHPHEDDAANDAGAAWIITNKPCSSPDGRTGDILYNTDENVMQYCNGVDWVGMGPDGVTSGSGCSNPTGAAGDIIFNEDYSVMQYCNSDDWVGVGIQDTLSQGLVGHWKLDDISGAFIDSVSGNDGTGAGGVLYNQSGIIGGSAGFDGSNDEITISGGPIYADTSKPFTFSAWVYLDNYAPFEYPHIANLKSDTSELFEIAFSNDPGYLGLIFGSEDAGWVNSKTDTLEADQVGEWKHVVIVYDGTGATSRSNFSAYINNVSQTLTAPSGFTTNGTETIIGSNSNVTEYWDGRIDDVRIYNRALSASEISLLYKKRN